MLYLCICAVVFCCVSAGVQIESSPLAEPFPQGPDMHLCINLNPLLQLQHISHTTLSIICILVRQHLQQNFTPYMHLGVNSTTANTTRSPGPGPWFDFYIHPKTSRHNIAFHKLNTWQLFLYHIFGRDVACFVPICIYVFPACVHSWSCIEKYSIQINNSTAG